MKKFVRYQTGDTVCYGELAGEEIFPLDRNFLDPGCQRAGSAVALSAVRLLAPVAPPNIIAIGVNYRGHSKETNIPAPPAPLIFLKATTAVTAPQTQILLPLSAPDEVDYEAELAVVIGKTAKQVAEDDALEYVFGYTCANDVSARDCQIKIDKQWARAKSFDTFCPLGPAVVQGISPDNLKIQSRVNGQTMQSSTTADLIFGVRKLVSYCSQNMTLLPGTLILTGTPSGVGYARNPQVFLREGDTVEIEIEGIGVLKNTVAAEA